MKGLDFFMACYRKGVDLPVRIFVDSKAPMNFYRPGSVCFINLEIDAEARSDVFSLLAGMDVSVIADRVSDGLRVLSRAISECQPRHLVVLAGETFVSWAPHRGWR